MWMISAANVFCQKGQCLLHQCDIEFIVSKEFGFKLIYFVADMEI